MSSGRWDGWLDEAMGQGEGMEGGRDGGPTDGRMEA